MQILSFKTIPPKWLTKEETKQIMKEVKQLGR